MLGFRLCERCANAAGKEHFEAVGRRLASCRSFPALEPASRFAPIIDTGE
jgi:hypothetical protein